MNYKHLFCYLIFANIILTVLFQSNLKNSVEEKKRFKIEENIAHTPKEEHDQVNHLCQMPELMLYNKKVMNTIEYEKNIMKERWENCSNPNFEIDSLIQIIRNDVMVKFDEGEENLTLKLDVSAIKVNFNLLEKDDLLCSFLKFDKKLNVSERSQLFEYFGEGIIFEPTKNYEINLNESGFFYLRCSIKNTTKGLEKQQENRVKIFDYVYTILPTDMQRLAKRRNEFKKYIDDFLTRKGIDSNSKNNHFKNAFINDDCPSKKSDSREKSKMNVLMIGLDSISNVHFDRVFPLTLKFLTDELEDTLRYLKRVS
jgi:hypothetical protein